MTSSTLGDNFRRPPSKNKECKIWHERSFECVKIFFPIGTKLRRKCGKPLTTKMNNSIIIITNVQARMNSYRKPEWFIHCAFLSSNFGRRITVVWIWYNCIKVILTSWSFSCNSDLCHKWSYEKRNTGLTMGEVFRYIFLLLLKGLHVDHPFNKIAIPAYSRLIKIR